MRKLLFIFGLVSIGLPLYISISWFVTPQYFEVEKEIIIPKGSSLHQITHKLYEAQIIPYKTLFFLRAYLSSSSLKAGLYKFSGSWTQEQIFKELKQGQIHLTKIRLAEGFNIWQIAKSLDHTLGLSEEEWLSLLNTPPIQIIENWKIDIPNWEGFLTPETYMVEYGIKPTQFLNNVLETFLKQNEALTTTPPPRPLKNAYEVLILASIVEKETGIEEEKPLVASVFINRLRKKMRLQADPTVIYGAWHDITDRIRKIHLTTPTPYNTYTNYGLPPTPICSPSRSSIEAALKPIETRYLYFVADGQGKHKFSETLSTHNTYVKEYLETTQLHLQSNQSP